MLTFAGLSIGGSIVLDNSLCIVYGVRNTEKGFERYDVAMDTWSVCDIVGFNSDRRHFEAITIHEVEQQNPLDTLIRRRS